MSYLIYSLEDDKNISRIINVSLTHQGYEVKSFETGKSFLDAFYSQKPDLILLDMMLPDIDGRDILKIIRDDSDNENIGIIIISAKSMALDKVDALDLGADDYISKPFDILELTSRVNVQFRHKEKLENKNELKYKQFRLLPSSKEVFIDNEQIKFTKKEFDIFYLLVKNHGQTVSREQLINVIWGENKDLETRTIDMHIKSIRNKLNDKDSKIIVSYYGVGYCFNL